jgi:hypothetical protein
LPIDGAIIIALSVDDGANWEYERTAFTNELGLFHAIFVINKLDTDRLAVGTCVLVCAGYNPSYPEKFKPVGKTAYMRITDEIGEIVIREPLEYNWDPFNLIRTRSPREVYFELPGGYVRFVDPTSLTINNTIAVTPECLSYRDMNGDGTLDLTLTLNTSAISQFILSRNMTTGNVTLLLTGRFYDNVMFGGTMIVIVRMPGDVNIDGRVDIKDLAQAAKSFGSYSDHPQWNPTSDENEDGKIDIRDLVLICKKFGTVYT